MRKHPRKIHVGKMTECGKGWITVGECEQGTNRIMIDYRYEIIPVLIHELLHAFHPRWLHTKVTKTTSALTNQLSQRQILRLLKLFASIL